MASATATASPDATARGAPAGLRRVRARFAGSKLGLLVLGLNLAGLLALVVGALVFNELRHGLLQARLDSLSTQGELISYVLEETATSGEPEPRLDAEHASTILQLLNIPTRERARLYARDGRLIADTDVIADKVLSAPLPPVRPRAGPGAWWGAAARRHGRAPRRPRPRRRAARNRRRAHRPARAGGARHREQRARGQRLHPAAARSGGAGRADAGGRRRGRHGVGAAPRAPALHPDRGGLHAGLLLPALYAGGLAHRAAGARSRQRAPVARPRHLAARPCAAGGRGGRPHPRAGGHDRRAERAHRRHRALRRRRGARDQEPADLHGARRSRRWSWRRRPTRGASG